MLSVRKQSLKYSILESNVIVIPEKEDINNLSMTTSKTIVKKTGDTLNM